MNPKDLVAIRASLNHFGYDPAHPEYATIRALAGALEQAWAERDRWQGEAAALARVRALCDDPWGSGLGDAAARLIRATLDGTE